MRLTMEKYINELREDLRIALQLDEHARACGYSSSARRREILGRAILLANAIAASQRPAPEPKP